MRGHFKKLSLNEVLDGISSFGEGAKSGTTRFNSFSKFGGFAHRLSRGLSSGGGLFRTAGKEERRDENETEGSQFISHKKLLQLNY